MSFYIAMRRLMLWLCVMVIRHVLDYAEQERGGYSAGSYVTGHV